MKPLLLEIVGDLDAYAAGFIATAMTGVEGEMGVVFEVGGVSFIDSAGLRCLETFRGDVLADEGRVWLHDPSRVVRRLLAILEIDRFEICGAVSPLDSPRHEPLRACPVDAGTARDPTPALQPMSSVV